MEKALQRSRLASVSVPRIKHAATRGKKSTPSGQVLTTTPALNYRRNFGLKRSMPCPLKSKYIIPTQYDTEHGMADYEPGSGKALLIKRLESLKQPVAPILRKQRDRPELGALLYGSTPSKLVKSVPRKHYKKWASTQGLNPDDTSTFDAFYQTLPGSQIDNSPLATAGSLYTLPGGLQTTPQGFTNQTVVPGRTLDQTGRQVAAAGVVATATVPQVQFGPKSSIMFKTPSSFVVERLKLHNDNINMDVRHTRPNTTTGISKRSLGRLVESEHERQLQTSSETPKAFYELIKKSLYI